MLLGGQANETIQFEARGKYATCRLRACFRGQVIDATATNFFEALCQIREALASKRLRSATAEASTCTPSVPSAKWIADSVPIASLWVGG